MYVFPLLTPAAMADYTPGEYQQLVALMRRLSAAAVGDGR
jgi:hypothetical protein